MSTEFFLNKSQDNISILEANGAPHNIYGTTSCHGFPSSIDSRHIMSTLSPSLNTYTPQYRPDHFPIESFSSGMGNPMDWQPQTTSGYQYAFGRPYSYNSEPAMPATHEDLWYARMQTESQACSRPWQAPSTPSQDINCASASQFVPSSIFTGSFKAEYVPNEDNQDFDELSISHSPPIEDQAQDGVDIKPDLASIEVLSCKSSDEEDEVVNESLPQCGDERTSEEPYAKLIHKALMAAPNHSMALQDIYEWFSQNTDRGADGTSGWRNSIRHNLSMNAAFRKSDRKLSGDSKKTSEWFLEDWAVLNGVTPTTRYRKPNNKPSRSHTPALSRQSIGRNGGKQAAQLRSKSKLKGRQHVHQNSEVTIEYIEHGGHFSRCASTIPSQSRHISPTTPRPEDGMPMSRPGPYYGKTLRYGGLEQEPSYSFENDITGAYGGEGPVFCEDAGEGNFGGMQVPGWSTFGY